MFRRFLPDRFTSALLLTVLLASVLPCRGDWATVFGWITDAAIALLFFLHGAKLSRQAVLAGITHWRLHLVVLASTFVLFPLLGWALRPLLAPLVTPGLYLGVLFLCALPSTVQSSIAFTSIARGNVSAAVCAASLSSLLGIFITPLLVGVLLETHGGGGMSWHAVGEIVLQLLVPFVAGQVAQHWIGGWVQTHRPLVGLVDQGSILLVVYTAFSASVLQGLWRQVPLPVLGGLLVVNAVLLALALLATRYGARALGFGKEDEITIVFCGSKKSLASGVPMAKVLFAGHPLGLIVLPIMLFHQLQLMVCAVLARRYARRGAAAMGEGDVAPAD
ncbi:MAG: bile acid:sodium symporter [Rhodanobacter sp. 68-29]|uniref:bile acid:sodium symporter family protein n=1 Tax=Rhodanobacter sp. PCA2 TaxID=2006117 RepID=UPI00086E1593|nr:bile acid:sodium symporter family protein [Rhodanobacter sp. PCA2]MBA2077119.1 bile acid:sodium symporter [Rhodanobacter sp. PCA2]MBN8922972.1 bile acid:sodium symporter [Rhodanobacter sp.]ODU75400.1 MAG: bile acid:sodium symporter [Rhodanobacter sp. SCN 69-32]OJY58624.1 MAG: bile acid:sodium symporter [Rhodanobacter sp. 68-29]